MRISGLASNDGDLIVRARRDPDAFAELYRRHYDQVFRYCVHRLFARDQAEDVTSGVFLKAVENLDRFRGDERGFRNWLYKIATNAVNRHLRDTARKRTLLERVSQQPHGDCEISQQEKDETSTALKAAILNLRPKYQALIALRFFQNKRITEIAQIVGHSPATVRSQLSRALAKLRKQLAAAKARYESGGDEQCLTMTGN